MRTMLVTFTSDGLALEGILRLPDGQGLFPGVALCHPHPLHGGEMRNTVAEAMAVALTRAGVATLAFNFRGVGNSQGSHDRGVGEVKDTLSAVTFLGDQAGVDRGRLGIAGYSFGAGIALDAAAEEHDLRAVVSVACPAAPMNDLVLHQINRPKLFIQGDADYVIELELFRFLAQRFSPPREVEVLAGADHSLRGYEARVGSMAAEFFKRTLG